MNQYQGNQEQQSEQEHIVEIARNSRPVSIALLPPSAGEGLKQKAAKAASLEESKQEKPEKKSFW